VADLAVLYPQSTVAFDRPGGRRGADPGHSTDSLQGLYCALLEGRFLFDFVHQHDLSPETLGRYRAVLLSGAAYLGGGECEQLRRYVGAGGSLLAAFETSRYTAWGDPRGDLALGDVFGVRATGAATGPAGNGYMRIETRHPVTAGFEGTALLPAAESRGPVMPKEKSPPVLSVVPQYPAFPPEKVYPRTPRTDEPAAVFRDAGRSRDAYFPGEIDRTCWRSGNPDLGRLLGNAVRWRLGGARRPVRVAGEGVVELFAWETEPGYALHLLNYTNPNMTRGFVRQFYRIGPQQVRFEVRAGRTIRGVRALRAGADLRVERAGTAVTFTVPSVLDYEVVALT
jgi:hypothetical protein